jgi:S1-C subfamily serine protease
MIRGILFFLLMLTPPADAHFDFDPKVFKIDLSPEFDDSYTYEMDPFAPNGLKASYLSSVVIQIATEEGTPLGAGSGNYFRLGKHRFIITAAHVVDGDNEILIIEKGFSMTKAKVVYIDHNSDIAVLVPETKLRYTKAIPFRRDINNQMGEKVYHCGHPANEGWHLSGGLLTGTHNDVLMVNTFAWPGSSGSVLFDEGGRVLGVVSRVRVDGPFGIPDLVEHIVLAGNIKMLDQKTLKAALKDGTK